MIFVVKIQLKKLSIGILNRFLITKNAFFTNICILQTDNHTDKRNRFPPRTKKVFLTVQRNYYYFYSAKTKHSKFTIACCLSFSFCIRFSYTDYSF